MPEQLSRQSIRLLTGRSQVRVLFQAPLDYKTSLAGFFILWELIMTESEWFEQLFNRLSHSKFRSSFHLKQKDKQYIQAKGMDTIEKHAIDFVEKDQLQPIFPTTGNKHLSKDTLYSLPNTLLAVVVDNVYINGIRSSLISHQAPNKKHILLKY